MNHNSSFILNKSMYEKIFIFVLLVSFTVWFGATLLSGANNDGFNIFYNKGDDIFADSSNVTGYSFNRDPYNETYAYGGKERAYPPFTYILYYIISKAVFMNPYIDADNFQSMYKLPQFLVVLTILQIITAILSYEIFRTIKNGGNITKVLTALGLILSMPILFTVERANTILISMSLNTFFIFCHDSKNKVVKELSLIALAISAALKMTPAVLGILLIYKKQWKVAIRTVIYGLFFFFAPFLMFKGGLSNVPVFFNNLSLNLSFYSAIDGCNLANWIRLLFPDISSTASNISNVIYTLLCVFILLSIPFMRKNWQKICGICLVLTILPSHSGYYCVLYMIPAALAFLNEEKHESFDFIAFLAFIMLFVHDIFTFLYVTGLLIMFIYMLYVSIISVKSSVSKRKTA